MAITYEEVMQVAEKLLQQEDMPTIEKIRVELGTGSHSTISKHLKTWRSKKLLTQAGVHHIINMPPDPVNQAVAKVWQQLQEENHAKFNEIERAAAKKIQVALEDKELAQHECDRLLVDTQDLRGLLKEARQQNAELEKKQIDMNQSYAGMHAKLQTLEEAYQLFQRSSLENLAKIEQRYQHALAQSELKINEIEKSKNEMISVIKDNAENNRHQYIVEIENLKTSNKYLQKELFEKDKNINKLTNKIAEFEILLTKQEQTINQWPSLFDKQEHAFKEMFNIYFSSFEKTISATQENIIAQFKKLSQKGRKIYEPTT